MSANTPPAVRRCEENGRRAFFIGPYRLAQKLGMGGMGVVYLAEHVETGQCLAVKTARDKRQVTVSALRREAQILEAIDHPGVVRFLDRGTSRGAPWFAMERLNGTTLGDVLGDAQSNYDSHLDLQAPATDLQRVVDPSFRFDGPTQPARSLLRRHARAKEATARFDLGAKRSLLVLVTELCHTLSHLHNEGVVHRDLKPSNVFIRAAREPVLVDFGVVGWFDGAYSRDRLAGIDRQRFAGTLQFMAPEQLQGSLVDARADLYALGCILYLGVTGRLPFDAPTPQEVMRRHLDGVYIAPDELIADVPRELIRLIHRLLARDPRDRVGHADIVARTLGTLIRGEQFGYAGLTVSSPSNHLSRPRFVGRQKLLERVLDAIREAGPTNLVMIGGVSGSGKTRLAMEVATTAERFGWLVTAESPETGVGEPSRGKHVEPLSVFRATLQQVADQCREYGAAETSRLVGRRAGVLAQYEPLLEGLPGNDGLEPPIELPPKAARMRAFAYLTETLAALAEYEPLLIIIDDLHLADDMSLEFLVSILRNGGLDGVTIATTYRLEDDSRLGPLLAMNGLHRFELEPLTDEAIHTLVKDMLAVDRVHTSLRDRLVSSCAGNPFVASEYLHAAVEEGLMSRRDDGSWCVDDSIFDVQKTSEVLSLSARVSGLLEGRLERLDGLERRLVDVAAVIARRFQRGLLARVTGLPAEQLEGALQRLVDRRILVESEGSYQLIEQLCRLTYDAIPEQKRRLLHQQVARALESRSADSIEAGQLVEHWRGAAMPSRELCYIEHAAEDALIRGASSEARELLRRGLRLLDQLRCAADDGPELRRARFERLLAKVYWSRGNLETTIRLLERSLAHLGYPVPERASAWGFTALGQTGRQLLHLLGSSPAETEAPKNLQLREEYLESSLALLWAWLLAGEFNKVVVMAIRLANLNDSMGRGRGLAVPYALLGALCRRLGVGWLAGVYEARARRNYGEKRSKMDFVGATQIFSYSNVARGEWDEAERLLRRARGVSERVGDFLNLENVLISEAVFEVCRSRYDRVRALVGRPEDPEASVRSDKVAAWRQVIWAMIARQRGDYALGAQLLDAAEAQIANLVTGQGFGLAVRASVELGRGDHALGFRRALEALSYFEVLSSGADTNLFHYPIYQYLCDAFIGCWCSDILSTHERERALGKARYLTQRLISLATHVPAASSASLRNQGLLAAVDGDLHLGSALLSESLAHARRYELPFEAHLTRNAAAMFATLPTHRSPGGDIFDLFHHGGLE